LRATLPGARTMTTQVKICGLTTAETLATALDAGADYVGLVFFPPSPRHIADVALARALADQARGRARIVALSVDADDALIDRISVDVRPDIHQLHGSETVERTRDIAARTGIDVMKVIKVREAADTAAAQAYVAPAGPCPLVLFDAKAPPGAILPGGNGLAFDWRLLEGVPETVPYMLSGGLTPENVTDAIRLTRARAVDVSSGVERVPGEKDPERIRAFIAAAKSL
jgi:phosphoribosylanthranilate isomerase